MGIWRRLWRPLLVVALLVAVVMSLSPAAVAGRLAQADLRLVMAAVLGLTAMHVVPAVGWRAILATTGGLRLTWRTTLSLYYPSQAIGGMTPANLGSDILRAAALRGAGDSWSIVIAPLIIQRATSYLALSALSLIALTTLAARTDLASEVVATGVVLGGAVTVASWILLAPPARLRGVHARIVRLVGGSTNRDRGRASRLGTASLIGLAQGMLFHIGSIGLTWLLVVAVDPGLPAASVVPALAVARLSLVIPLVPSGLGVGEGALVILFIGLGLPAESGLAAMLLARLSLVLTTAVGMTLLIRPRPVVPEAEMTTSR
jgi:uncharacterized membrane protein YbhN (UPF0104 family)